jgi:hypothetical protein
MPTHQSVRSQPHRPENQHLLGKLTQLPTRPTLLPHRPDSTALLFTDPNPPTCFTLIRSPIDLFFSRFWPSCCFPLLPWKRIILWIGVHHQSHPLCQRPPSPHNWQIPRSTNSPHLMWSLRGPYRLLQLSSRDARNQEWVHEEAAETQFTLLMKVADTQATTRTIPLQAVQADLKRACK